MHDDDSDTGGSGSPWVPLAILVISGIVFFAAIPVIGAIVQYEQNRHVSANAAP
ncbi:MAG: hypothetical protein KGI41_00475 [Patescibacteria group bacterium]|nr:hypothetical protein [Patescibacteria group bacterium]MDE1965704.1 hypothetical protein [Patescibacteria group bacterium]